VQRRRAEREEVTGENFIERSFTNCDISRKLLESSNQRGLDKWSK
jgi:hypothetical protein